MNILSFGADSAGICDELEGAQPCRMVVEIGHDDKFVGAGFRNERLDAGANRLRRRTPLADMTRQSEPLA